MVYLIKMKNWHINLYTAFYFSHLCCYCITSNANGDKYVYHQFGICWCHHCTLCNSISIPRIHGATMGSASIYVPILPICGLSQYKHQYFHPGGYLIRSVSTIHTREYSTFPKFTLIWIPDMYWKIL